MQYLFICRNYSGNLVPLITWLAARKDNHVLLASDKVRQSIGIEKIILRKATIKAPLVTTLDYLGHIIQSAKMADRSFTQVRQSGFMPDIIFDFAQSGASLAAAQIFAEAFKICCLERYNFAGVAQKQANDSLRDIMILNSHLTYAYAPDMAESLPAALRPTIKLLPLCVDAQYFKPLQQKKQQAMIFYLKNLEGADLFKWLNLVFQLLQSKKWQAILLLPNSAALKMVHDKMQSFPEHLSCLAAAYTTPTPEALLKMYNECQCVIAPGATLSYELLCAFSCGALVACNLEDSKFKINRDFLELDENFNFLEQISPKMSTEIGKNARKVIVKHFSAQKIMPEIVAGIMQSYK